MISMTALWLPILLSAVFAFIASSILNMLLKFWHRPDSHALSNEDEVRAVLRQGIADPGIYMLPFCTPENMKQPEMRQKLAEGPNALILVRAGGHQNMGLYLGAWFLFCLLVSLFCAFLATPLLPAGAAHAKVFHTIGLAALMGYAFGTIPNAIWWAHPPVSAVKHFIDGVIYALITAATFAWLWPAA